MQKKLTTKGQHVSKPLIFDLAKKSDQKKIADLQRVHPELVTQDYYEAQLEELFAIEHPTLIRQPAELEKQTKEHIAHLTKQSPLTEQGRWVYFSWINTLVHILKEHEYFLLRTSRNQYLISPEEQKQFYQAKVGIGGLSVGSSVAMAIALQGGAKHMRLADFDTLMLSNTNRIRAGIQHIGERKTEIIAKHIYEINPYAELEIYNQGITPENISAFTEGLDVIVDELDDLSVKVLLRTEAKRKKIPMVMGADNGNSAVVDIERYDEQKTLQFFHGRLGTVSFAALKQLDKFGIGRLIAKLIGPENHEERMLRSLLEMGKTIVSWPQLGGTALLNGSAVAYCVRKIVTHQPLNADRAIINLDSLFAPAKQSPEALKLKRNAVKQFKKIFNL